MDTNQRSANRQGDAPTSADRAAEADRRAVARIRDLELENTRLRRIVADRDLEIETLREISRGTY